ncbi:hypothetical protein GIB67_043215 [Kingdonia uniflora]|uniref:RING-type E3 ubiquitin transferase n=1 Tax=Kingdonia uniflora TaxID=39325 RepID=A0A7J7NK52_9MAGN|nr:hypothetical protein GIB67_043215 [Kingdonia uniflora]
MTVTENISVLASEGVEFLLSSEGKAPLSSIDHRKTVCLLFSASWSRPCKAFTPVLVQLYEFLKSAGTELEIVFVSLDRNEKGFLEHCKGMPWLTVPFNSNARQRLRDIYHVSDIPSLIPLGNYNEKYVQESAVGLVEDYGIDAFPFTRARKEELKALDYEKLYSGNLEQLLGETDFVMAGDGRKVLVSELNGTTVGLYFGAHWCPPCQTFTSQLTEAYNELKNIQKKNFEIIFVSTDRDQKEFNLNISTMPWLAVPYYEKTRRDLSRIFDIKGIPCLIFIGPNGVTLATNGREMISSYGANAFPFTVSRVTELETAIQNEGNRLKQQVQDRKHEHVLKLDTAKAYIQCKDVVLEDMDIAKAIIEYVSHAAIETLVVGSSSRNAFIRRFKTTDVPTTVSKGAPDFCSVYVINKGKIATIRTASRPAPSISPLKPQIQNQVNIRPEATETNFSQISNSSRGSEMPSIASSFESRISHDELEFIKSPFGRGGRVVNGRPYGEISLPDTDISFVSSGRPSTDRMFPSLYDHLESQTPRLSNSSDIDSRSFESVRSGGRPDEFCRLSHDSGHSWSSSGNMEDVEAEMRRLKLELKQTMDMYSTACKEALTAKQKAMELHRWKMEEEQKLEDAKLAEEAALAIAAKEKAKCRAAMEAAEASQRIAELEAQKRVSAEMKALKESEEKRKVLDVLAQSDVRYRKYSIEEIEVATEYFVESRKIGEGGYGPVYKCYLDHTPVAIKVLRPDAAQGRSQFQQEIEVLSCIRHPNMVLLLGACPEYGCLVYEYMGNGSLDDRLFCRGNSPVLSWQLRFRIAAEIGTGLLFLHQTKPEPLVHRDLKPGNILLDRNYVSKISDVGLARLVPPTVANNVTQYRMTSTAGTFCYIDPEYQQTGMLGIKSDIYSLGIMLLQLITAKPPMGLTHHVERAIEKGMFAEMLDPAVPDWPIEEALCFAKLSLKCSELRRKDRPDLGKEILPVLNKLRQLAEENMHQLILGGSGNPSPNNSYAAMPQDVMSDPLYDSSKSRSSGASLQGRSSVN